MANAFIPGSWPSSLFGWRTPPSAAPPVSGSGSSDTSAATSPSRRTSCSRTPWDSSPTPCASPLTSPGRGATPSTTPRSITCTRASLTCPRRLVTGTRTTCASSGARSARSLTASGPPTWSPPGGSSTSHLAPREARPTDSPTISGPKVSSRRSSSRRSGTPRSSHRAPPSSESSARSLTGRGVELYSRSVLDHRQAVLQDCGLGSAPHWKHSRLAPHQPQGAPLPRAGGHRGHQESLPRLVPARPHPRAHRPLEGRHQLHFGQEGGQPSLRQAPVGLRQPRVRRGRPEEEQQNFLRKFVCLFIHTQCNTHFCVIARARTHCIVALIIISRHESLSINSALTEVFLLHRRHTMTLGGQEDPKKSRKQLFKQVSTKRR